MNNLRRGIQTLLPILNSAADLASAPSMAVSLTDIHACYLLTSATAKKQLCYNKNNYCLNIEVRLMTVEIDIDKLLEVYGVSQDNWGDLPNFYGDYINYGYWKNIPLSDDRKITFQERVYSSIALYKEVLKYFELPEYDHIVEVGCGRGMGLIDVLSKIKANQITGIDINKAQIERAAKNIKRRIGDSTNIRLVNRPADDTTLYDNSADWVCSVEAPHHFPSIEKFAVEARRILKPNGKLVFATYFPTDKKYLSELKKILPLIDEHLENITPINEVCVCLSAAGFSDVKYEKIGEYTFIGYEKWITQEQIQTPFSHNYYKAYNAGYIDYYVINANY